MADRVLLGWGVFAKCSPIAFGWNEQRVIAETLVASFDKANASFTRSLGDNLGSVWPTQHHDRAEPCCASTLRRPDQLGHQPLTVCSIVVVTTAVIRRFDAGSAAKGVDLEPTVVCKCNLTRRLGNSGRFQASVSHKSARILDDLGHISWTRQKNDGIAKGSAHLGEFVIICRGGNHDQRMSHDVSCGEQAVSATPTVAPR